jgi:hypothetical protein
MSASFNFDPSVIGNMILGFFQAVANAISAYLGPVADIVATVAGLTIMFAVLRKMPVVGGLIDKVVGYIQSAF